MVVTVESPDCALIEPVIAYLDVLEKNWPADKEEPETIVVPPGDVARSWRERLLDNRSARRPKAALAGRHHGVIADVPYRRER